MNDEKYGRHVQAVHDEIKAILTKCYPSAQVPKMLFRASKIARSELEVKQAVQKMCGDGILELRPGSENAYRLATAGKSVSTRVEPPKAPAGPSIKQLILDHITKNGPTKAVDLVDEHGSSTYPSIALLKNDGVITCISPPGERKVWDLTERVKSAEQDDEPESDEDALERLLNFVRENGPVTASRMAQFEPRTSDLLQQLSRKGKIVKATGRNGWVAPDAVVPQTEEPEQENAANEKTQIIDMENVSPKMIGYIDDLVAEGGYGDTRGEVVEWLIWAGIRDLVSRGLIDRREAKK